MGGVGLPLVTSSIFAFLALAKNENNFFLGSMERPQKLFPVFRVMAANNKSKSYINPIQVLYKCNISPISGFIQNIHLC